MSINSVHPCSPRVAHARIWIAALSVLFPAVLVGQGTAIPILLPQSLTEGVGAKVVSPNGKTVEALSDASILESLTITSETVHQGDDIKSLLRTRNIRPDAQALAFVAQLNPTISRLDQLKVGDHIRVPTVLRTSSALRSAAQEHKVAITFASVERAEVTRSAAALSQQLDSAMVVRAVAPEVAANLRASATALARPVLTANATEATLHNVKDNVAAARAIVTRIATGTPESTDGAAIVASAAALGRTVNAISNCREAGTTCIAQLTVTPISATTRKAVTNVRLFYAPILYRLDRNCNLQNSQICRRDFYTNAPAYQVSLSQEGNFVVWAMKGAEVVSCDLQIEPPIQSGSRTLEIYASPAERSAANCAALRMSAANGQARMRAVASRGLQH